jgi:GT2 family glycosyltransferase
LGVLLDLLKFVGKRMGGAATRRRAPSLSVGMAAHGNARTTRKALDALFASAAGDFELVLVDDRSPDETLAVFREARARHRNTRIFSFTRNLDYCESVNAFLSHARGDRLLFLSNDIFASPAYLRVLLETAAANPGCGILRGCSNFVDTGSPSHMVPLEGGDTREAYFAFAEEIAARHGGGSLIDERWLVGDAFLVTRAVIDRIGTFDTRFVGYFGDVDFGLRAQIAGFRVVLERRAYAFHQTHGNIAYLPEEQQKERWQRRRARVSAASTAFLEKYGLQPERDGIEHLPWYELSRRRFDPALHRVAPKDYSGYLLPG